MTSPLEAALSYAASGFSVLPLRKLSKLPATPNGKDDATTNKHVIEAWWSSDPSFGVGIAIPDNMVVVDIDTVGELSLKVHGKALTDTAKVRTMRGHHYYYYLPAGFKKELSKRKVGYLPDVDLLINGFVIAPPTLHPLSGDRYEWEVELDKENIEEAPFWVWFALEEEAKHEEWRTDDHFIEGIPEGHRNEYIFKRVCRLCRLGNTRGEALDIAMSLRSKSGLDDDVKAMVDRVWKQYRAADERKREDADKETHGKIWSLADLLDHSTEPPDYLVDRLIPGGGYSILFGSQGAGKSVLADQIGVAVATGRPVFGRAAKSAGVLVMDLEQDPNGAAQRWRPLLRAAGLEQAPANLFTVYDWPPVDAGGMEYLADFLGDHPQVRLIIVDSLYNIAPESIGEGYFKDGKVMGKFTRFAKSNGVAFLINHHSRKQGSNGPDNFSDLASGTRGITGPARARLGLVREEFGTSGKLMVSGKLPESTLNLTFDADSLIWR